MWVLPSLYVGEQPARGGASHLWQQWATHTQPKLHMTKAADGKLDEEKEHWEGSAGVKEGVGVWEDGGGVGMRGDVGMCESEGEERVIRLKGQTVSGTTTGEDVFCVCCVWRVVDVHFLYTHVQTHTHSL